MDEHDLLEDEGTEGVLESEEPVEDSLEEPQDASAGTEGFEEDESGLDEDDPLDLIPEEHRDLVRRYATRRVGEVQSKWQSKLDEAAELRKKAEIVDQFNERFEKDPHGLLKELQRIAPAPTETGPKDPGEMPDPVEDPEAWKKWYAADKQYQAYQIRRDYEDKYKEVSSSVQGMQQAAKHQAQQAKMSALQNEYGLDDDQMKEFFAEMQRVSQDTEYAWRTLMDRVKGRHGKAKAKAANRKRVKEAVQGEEERPGLPATGVHAKVPETGDAIMDVLAQMKAEGKVPDGLFD